MSVQGLLADLAGLATSARDFTDVFESVANDFLEVSAEHFDSAGGSGGTPWEPLSRRTLDERQRRGLGVQPLVYDSPQGGRILRALTDQGAPYQIRDVQSDQVRVGTNIGIAETLHFGRGAVPARPIISITEDVEQRWVDAMAAHLDPEASQPGRFGL